MVLGTGPGEGTGGREGSGQPHWPTPPWLPCFSPPCPHHAGPCPLPVSSSCYFREEYTKATVVSTDTNVHCLQLPEGASWAGSRSQPGPNQQQAVSTSGSHLTLCRGRRPADPLRGLPSRLLLAVPILQPFPYPLTVLGAARLPLPLRRCPVLRPYPNPPPGLCPQEPPQPAFPLQTEVLPAGSFPQMPSHTHSLAPP